MGGASQKALTVLLCWTDSQEKVPKLKAHPFLLKKKKKDCDQDAAPNIKEIEKRKLRSGPVKELRWISQQEGAGLRRPILQLVVLCKWRVVVALDVKWSG